MAATGAGARVDVTLKLSQLQNFCKRDPQGYKSEYDAQIRRLESELGILATLGCSTGNGGGGVTTQNSSNAASSQLTELMQFAAAVSSSSYKGEESDRIVNLLIHLLVGSTDADDANNENANAVIARVSFLSAAALELDRNVRKTAVSALILMRNKGVVEPLRLLQIFFRLLAVVPDKGLREILYKHLVNDVRNLNKKHRADALNRSIQTFLHRVVSTHGVSCSSCNSGGGSHQEMTTDESSTNVAAKKAVDMVCELYRRRVWNDERTVAILASGVTSPNQTVMCRAIRFFLNIEETMAEDASKRLEEQTNAKNRIDYHSHSRKTAARQRHVDKQLKNRKKALKRKESAEDWMDSSSTTSGIEQDKGVEAAKKLYPAIELLRDPQGLAEALLKRLRTLGSSYKYEVKLLMMNFCTRLVGNHQLLLLPLYPFLTKYLTSHQRHVTQILAFAVQGCHDQVPPDEVYAILKTIAHNFITERCSEEQMAVGINAARAICSRVPSVMSEEESQDTTSSGGGGIGGGSGGAAVCMDIQAFACDLAAFGNHRDRSVSIAGKAWLNFVREVNPSLLQGKKARGLKGAAGKRAGVKPLRYGEQHAATGVEGADLLVEYESKKAARRLQRHQEQEHDDEDDDVEDGWEEEEEEEGEGGEGSEQDEGDEGWEEVGEGDEEEEEEEEEEQASDSDSAPNLVLVDESGKDVVDNNTATAAAPAVLDVSKMSVEERNRLKQEVSSTRIFSASDFDKMRKLVERERRLKTDPREAARRKRAAAKGQDVQDLSGDESSSSDDDEDGDDQIRIKGAVNPNDLIAEAKKKRQTKSEKLEKIIAGRTKFESKRREGGSTNVEKKRKKNFMMSKFSQEARSKSHAKGVLSRKRSMPKKQMTHEAKKRRRRL